MVQWSSRPVIYELNTWAWLYELSERYGRPVTLESVPEEVWDGLSALGVEAVWLMGVWERSPAGVRIAGGNAMLRAEFERVLPDFELQDNIGSAYCIRRYRVDERLGGDSGLTVARRALAGRGLKLILDYVPNHIARDHPWVSEHPEYMIRGDADDLQRDPDAFFASNGQTIACGRDPYFPPWQDVAQVNAFDHGLRLAAIDTVTSIAERCDGVRCDMAMLMMNGVFANTWGERAGPPPETDFWPKVIDAVRQHHPHLLFIAEAYWDLEWALQQQGFDFCYDKRLYDRLQHDDAASVRLHLHANRSYQDKLLRFIENHDEPRAAVSLVPPAKEKAAAVAVMSLPGAKLLHEGQFEGYRLHLPVFLRRRPEEPANAELRDFYWLLLHSVGTDGTLGGEWSLCETGRVAGQFDHTNLLAWCWKNGSGRLLIAINYSHCRSQGRIRLPWDDMNKATWHLADPINATGYVREGTELSREGLYVDLVPWGYHCLDFSRV